jgi:hypothetical protein
MANALLIVMKIDASPFAKISPQHPVFWRPGALGFWDRKLIAHRATLDHRSCALGLLPSRWRPRHASRSATSPKPRIQALPDVRLCSFRDNAHFIVLPLAPINLTINAVNWLSESLRP